MKRLLMLFTSSLGKDFSSNKFHQVMKSDISWAPGDLSKPVSLLMGDWNLFPMPH